MRSKIGLFTLREGMKMINQIKVNSQIIRYLVVGGAGYIVELVVITLARAAGATAAVSVAISFTVGFVATFFLQKLLTFRDSRMHKKVVAKQFVAVTALVIVNFWFAVLVANLLDGVVSAQVSRTISLAITTIWNFILYKKIIFKPQKSTGITDKRA